MSQIDTKVKNRILSIIEAFLITFAIFDIGHFSASDILLGLIFAVLFIVIDGIKNKETDKFFATNTPKINRWIWALSIVFTGSYLIYSADSLNGGMENKMFVLVYILLATLGFLIGINMALRIIMNKLIVRRPDYVEEGQEISFSVKTMIVCSAIVFVAMLPLFILNYPATMTVDSFDQLRQVRGMAAYSDHHPWVHTMIIKALYSFGYLAGGNVNSGLGLYVIFQMLVTAVSVGYSAAAIKGIKKSNIWSGVIVAGYILYPYHLAYAITIWKDILFADMVLVLTVTLYKLIAIMSHEKVALQQTNGADGKKAQIRPVDYALLIISGIGMCLIRHNGLYGYILTAVIVLMVMIADARRNKEKTETKKRLASAFTIIGITILIAGIIKGPVQSACGVKKGDYAHNLAVPLQQLARTVCCNGSISDSDIQKLTKINSIEYIKNNYEPGGADNMIQWLVAGDSEYFEAHKSEYLGIWVRTGLKNPIAYLRAYADQTKGYYTTMMPEQIAYYGILPNEDGLENAPLNGETVRIKINELCSKIQDMLPVYGIFYSMGACLLLLLLGMVVAYLNNEKAKIITALPVLALTITILIATPLVADLRYAYPLMLCFPTLTAVLIGRDK